LADLVAVLLGHDDVAEHDVRTDLRQLLEREPAVADRDHLEVLVREGEFDDLLDRDAVVREQNLLAHPLWRPQAPLESDEDSPFPPVCQRVSGISPGFRTQPATEGAAIARTTSWVDAPGRNTSEMPSSFNSTMSCAGMIPPTNTRTDSMRCSRSSSTMRRQIGRCAPERMLRPITSASSWAAAATICSGLWRSPV